jgi:polyhydroxybutyrate depolymerase
MRDDSDLDAFAEQHGFVVAYLEAWDRAAHLWAIGGNTEPDVQGIDDVRFTADLIDHLSSTMQIDPDRVFAVGFSNGAQMAHRLGCVLEDRIGGIASVAATIRPNIAEECSLSSAVAAIFVQGTADEVFWWGGIPGGELSASGTVELWAELDGCPLVPEIVQLPDTTEEGSAIERTRYSQCDRDIEVVLYAIVGGRHAWPSVASKAIVEFFANDGKIVAVPNK